MESVTVASWAAFTAASGRADRAPGDGRTRAAAEADHTAPVGGREGRAAHRDRTGRVERVVPAGRHEAVDGQRAVGLQQIGRRGLGHGVAVPLDAQRGGGGVREGALRQRDGPDGDAHGVGRARVGGGDRVAQGAGARRDRRAVRRVADRRVSGVVDRHRDRAGGGRREQDRARRCRDERNREQGSSPAST